MWANLLLLFVLSLIPFTTAWMGDHPRETAPVMLYGVNLLMCAFAFILLEKFAVKFEGNDSILAKALTDHRKEGVSLLLYISGVVLARWYPVASLVCYALMVVIWFIPDRRIEKELKD